MYFLSEISALDSCLPVCMSSGVGSMASSCIKFPNKCNIVYVTIQINAAAMNTNIMVVSINKTETQIIRHWILNEYMTLRTSQWNLLDNMVYYIYIMWYYTLHDKDKDRISIILNVWPHKGYSIPRPHGRDMEYLLWAFWRKMVML